jgi:hypothetical protein
LCAVRHAISSAGTTRGRIDASAQSRCVLIMAMLCPTQRSGTLLARARPEILAVHLCSGHVIRPGFKLWGVDRKHVILGSFHPITTGISGMIQTAIQIMSILASRRTSISSHLEPTHSHRKSCDNNADRPAHSETSCHPPPSRLRSAGMYHSLRSASLIFLVIALPRTESRMLAD